MNELEKIAIKLLQEVQTQQGKIKKEPGIFGRLSEEEISVLPTYKKEIIVLGCVCHVRKKQGKRSEFFEIRYRRNGFNLSVSGKYYPIAIKRFAEKLKAALAAAKEVEERRNMFTKNGVPLLFGEFAMLYFEKFRKPRVAPITYANDFSRLKNHILPKFGNCLVAEILPLDLLNFLDKYEKAEQFKTREELRSLLNLIFKFAIANGILDRNPLALIVYDKPDQQSGRPLTKSEETELLEKLRTSPYFGMAVIALYTGIRPCEWNSVRLENGFVIAQNRKQKKRRKIVYKRIPISPMLAPYISELPADFATRNVSNAKKAIKRAMPSHRPYDLRTTFATRCQECGVSEQVVQTFMGHSPSTLLGRVYTKFSDEFLISEAQKIRY